MQQIIPHLWFDQEAAEAAVFYTGLFENSEILGKTVLPGTPSGDAELVDFTIAGLRCMAISAGPFFTFNPSVSFMVSCRDEEEVDWLHRHLHESDLMPLGEYPFSKKYAWVQDRYGLSWQLMMDESMEENRKIRPVLLFSGDACGKAETAVDYYVSVFSNAKKGYINRYAEGEAVDARAKINYGELAAGGINMVVMDHGFGGDFGFNEAFSFMVLCKDQTEIDFYWDKLSFVPEAEECGWVKDQFGLSWQISPCMMNEVLMKGSEAEIRRVTQAFLKMKKFDLAELEKARTNR